MFIGTHCILMCAFDVQSDVILCIDFLVWVSPSCFLFLNIFNALFCFYNGLLNYHYDEKGAYSGVNSVRKQYKIVHIPQKIGSVVIKIWLKYKAMKLLESDYFAVGKEVVKSSQSAVTCNCIRISRRNVHKMIPWEPLTDVWYRVSQNLIFF